MRQTQAHQLLESWEAARSQPMPVRAAALAALASDCPLGEVMRWSIPRRDHALFAFRAQVFGDAVDGVTSCPRCAAPLELQLSLSDVRPRDDSATSPEWRTLRLGGSRVRWRRPTTEDLVAVSELRDRTEVRAALIARCIRTDDDRLRDKAAALLPAEPTDVHLNLSCPSCDHAWQTPFDIATYAWRELDEWAQRTLQQIHVLARAYGWTEDDVLRLSARRRQTYVEMNQ